MFRFAFAAAAIFILLTVALTAFADESPVTPRSSGSAATVGGGAVLYGETAGIGTGFQRDFDGGYSGGEIAMSYIAVEGDADDVSARARVSASGLSLVNGRVTIDAISMAVSAGGGGTGVTEASASGLVVDGKPVSAGPGTRLLLAGYGTILLFEQFSPRAGEIRANAVRLEPDGSGAAPGGPASIGSLSAEVAAPAPAPAPAPEPPPADPPPADPSPVPPADQEPAQETAPAPTPDLEPPLAVPENTPPPAAKNDPPSATPSTPRLPPATPIGDASDENRQPDGLAPVSVPQIGLPVQPLPDDVGSPDFDGYVFPVFGDNVGYSDTYGAPRAVVNWHRGTDIFAPTGTPLLAVADGDLFLVGTNRLGGNRLWLRDDTGNEFYYAHLSAFSPLAAEGARVSAGDVIGFVGNSGDAITTPPHLHFEVHPGGLDSVNPYPYLLAWQRRTDVPLAFREAAVAVGQAPAAGALIIEVTPDRDVTPKSESGLATPVS